MALVAADYIKPVKTIAGTSTPIITMKKAAGTAIHKGSVIIATSGLAVIASDNPATGTVIGISVEKITAAQALTEVKVCPALQDVIFEGRTATGADGATVTIDDADLFVAVDLALYATNNIWYLDVAASPTVACAAPIKRLDVDSTAWAKVEFMIVDSFWNKE